TSDQYAWDATRAVITGAGGAADTVDINSFFRLSAPAAAWRVGGARFTRDAIQQMSAYLWPYPYPQMTSMEGVLASGGMEYPMMFHRRHLRSEEHTSELQSRENLVCRLLLE